MAVYQVKIPAFTFAGEGSIEKVKDIVEKEQAKTALVFTDQGIKNAGILTCLTEGLDKLGIVYHVTDDLKAEPAYTDVEKTVEESSAFACDLIFAIGGGSVMDAAKLFSEGFWQSCTERHPL